MSVALETAYRFIQLLFLMFTILTVPVYVTVLHVLWRSTADSFDGSFFTLFVSTGIADLWLFVHKYSTVHIPRWLALVFGVCLMAVNRLLLFCLPTVKVMENRRTLRVFMFGQWALPLVFAVPMLFPGWHSVYSDDYRPMFNNSAVSHAYYTVDLALEVGIISPALILIHLLIYVSIVVETKKAKARSAARQAGVPVSASASQRMERRLALTGAVICGVYEIQCSAYILNWLGYDFWWIYPLFYYSSDLFTAINPWLLLAFSSAVRRQFLLRLFCSRHCVAASRRVGLFTVGTFATTGEHLPTVLHRRGVAVN